MDMLYVKEVLSVPYCSPKCQLRQIRSASLVARTTHISDEHVAPDDATLRTLTEQLYKPLIAQQYRVIKILPGTTQRPLECRLLRATLTTLDGARLDEENDQECLVEYHALSYSWGWPARTCSVTCNGIQFPVTLHLKNALHSLRLPDRARYIWTDAFCINQYNQTEKGEQVQIMFSIFRKAQRVIGWLGSSANRRDQEDLFAWLQHYSDQTHPGPHKSRTLNQLHSQRGNLLCRCLRNPLSRAVVELVQQNSWFRRTWIRQEVFAAKEVEMRYGPYSFDLQTLSELVQQLDGIDRKPEMQPFRIMLKRHKLSVSGKSVAKAGGTFGAQRWLDLALSNAQGFEASLDQDRIFALQNLAQPEDTTQQLLFPTIDYEVCTEELFEQFIKRLMFQEDTLNPLGILEDRRGFESSDLPSWVLDWRKPKTRLESMKPHRPLGLDISQPSILSINGVLLGSVSDEWPMHSYPDSLLTEDNLYNGYYNLYRPFRSGIPGDQPSEPLPGRLRSLEEIAYKACDYVSESLTVEEHKLQPYVLVSVVVRPGDLLVSFSKVSATLKAFGDPSRAWCAAVRECTSQPGRYTFLGRCVFAYRHGPAPDRVSYGVPPNKTKQYLLV